MVVLDSIRGHELGGTRPCLIVSVNPFNRTPAEIAVVVPLTSRRRNIPTHVAVNPPEGGLHVQSFIRCEDVRCVSQERLIQQRGTVSATTMAQVELRLRLILGL